MVIEKNINTFGVAVESMGFLWQDKIFIEKFYPEVRNVIISLRILAIAMEKKMSE